MANNDGCASIVIGFDRTIEPIGERTRGIFKFLRVATLIDMQPAIASRRLPPTSVQRRKSTPILALRTACPLDDATDRSTSTNEKSRHFREQLILRIADRGRTENLVLRSKSTPLRLCGRRAHSTKPPIDPLQRTMTLGKICNFWTHQRVKVLPCGSADGVPTQRSHRSFHSLMIQTESLKISCARRSSTSDKTSAPIADDQSEQSSTISLLAL